MTYNVFGGTLNLTGSVNQSVKIHMLVFFSLVVLSYYFTYIASHPSAADCSVVSSTRHAEAKPSVTGCTPMLLVAQVICGAYYIEAVGARLLVGPYSCKY